MIPITDVIPTRTAPTVTIGFVAASVVLVSSWKLGHTASLLANVICLWLFGWTLEDRLGHARFAALFVICGALGWLLGSAQSAVAGGVAGVLGGYFLLYPKSLLLILVPLPSVVKEVPAITVLALWFMSQMLLGPFPFVPQLAGFFGGALLTLVLKRPERLRIEWWAP